MIWTHTNVQSLVRQKKNGKNETIKDQSPPDKKQDRKASAALRAELAPLRKEIKGLETKISKLNQSVEKLDQQLSDPDLFQRDPDKAVQLGKDRAQCLSDIELAETEWMDKVEALEEAEQAQQAR